METPTEGPWDLLEGKRSGGAAHPQLPSSGHCGPSHCTAVPRPELPSQRLTQKPGQWGEQRSPSFFATKLRMTKEHPTPEPGLLVLRNPLLSTPP